MLFISGLVWVLSLAHFVVVYGLICVIFSGHPTSISFLLALLGLLVSLLQFVLGLVFLSKCRE